MVSAEGEGSEDGPGKGRVFFWESRNCSEGRLIVHICEDITNPCLLWNIQTCYICLCVEHLFFFSINKLFYRSVLSNIKGQMILRHENCHRT